jgi:hypothetical protein
VPSFPPYSHVDVRVVIPARVGLPDALDPQAAVVQRVRPRGGPLAPHAQLACPRPAGKRPSVRPPTPVSGLFFYRLLGCLAGLLISIRNSRKGASANGSEAFEQVRCGDAERLREPGDGSDLRLPFAAFEQRDFVAVHPGFVRKCLLRQLRPFSGAFEVAGEGVCGSQVAANLRRPDSLPPHTRSYAHSRLRRCERGQPDRAGRGEASASPKPAWRGPMHDAPRCPTARPWRSPGTGRHLHHRDDVRTGGARVREATVRRQAPWRVGETRTGGGPTRSHRPTGPPVDRGVELRDWWGSRTPVARLSRTATGLAGFANVSRPLRGAAPPHDPDLGTARPGPDPSSRSESSTAACAVSPVRRCRPPRLRGRDPEPHARHRAFAESRHSYPPFERQTSRQRM